MTIHVWPQNWGWFDPAASKGSAKDLEHAWKASVAYIDAAVAVAASLAKPLVVEEFGLARDNGRSTGGSTSQRDAFYTKMCSYLAAKPGTVAGLNFWAWAGEGRPREPGANSAAMSSATAAGARYRGCRHAPSAARGGRHGAVATSKSSTARSPRARAPSAAPAASAASSSAMRTRAPARGASGGHGAGDSGAPAASRPPRSRSAHTSLLSERGREEGA